MAVTTPANRPKLVLASTSPFRRELLQRLEIDFITVAPEVDESRKPEESPEIMVQRLAQLKAEAVAKIHRDALIIGSDQVATIGEKILGKPGGHQQAAEQLMLVTGKIVMFHTGLCLLNSSKGSRQVVCEPFSVEFRDLTRDEIENYLQREKPYNCAGSFKSEGLGITLFRKMSGNDPNALIGLPLIRLVEMLNNEGINPLNP